MTLDEWSDRNESLNAFCAAIRQGTHGLIRKLSLDLTNDDCVVVRGSCHSYYGVQLAIHTAKQFGEKHSVFSETQLVLSVGGSTLKFAVAHPAKDEARDSVSTHDADRRPRLTVAASA